MKQFEIFDNAEWICESRALNRAKEGRDGYYDETVFTVAESEFLLPKDAEIINAELYVIGFGFFHAYINGNEITKTPFQPLSTDFEERDNYPKEEKLHGHRIYVPHFDVKDCISGGKNTLKFRFGGGWYTFSLAQFGYAKLIYRLCVETTHGKFCFVSNPQTTCVYPDTVYDYYFTKYEYQDYRLSDSAKRTCPVVAKPLDTDYLFDDEAPKDIIDCTIPFKLTADINGVKHYTCEKNITGYAVLRLTGKAGDKVFVRYSENANADGTIDETYNQEQRFSAICDGNGNIVMPEFTWFGFQAFSVEGDAEIVEVRFVHFDAKVSSSFKSSDETLNWLYNAFVNTEKCNMHNGIISDCPHIERRGYTGDGQLTGHAVMDIFDIKSFYKKWIEDISDCQDIYSGHIQYTAPYVRSGGGPGGWGCAIVEVPYNYYLHYGDAEPMKRLYPQMLRYFDYLEEHSEFSLITSDKKDEWCLGDWCPADRVVLPAPFVNNYYYIRSLYRTIEIAKLIGRECDIPKFEKTIEERKAALMAAYYNTWDENFFGCKQGANAFAVDIGIGGRKTYANMVEYYKGLGRLDTGICGTDLVIKVLFEHGDGELALSLLTSKHTQTFYGMRMAGATTLWENWPEAIWDRSRNHPMFGAVTAYLFDYLLGIRQETGNIGYKDIVIAPYLSDALPEIEGSRTLPNGVVYAKYSIKNGRVFADIHIDEGINGVFKYKDFESALHTGDNTLEFTL